METAIAEALREAYGRPVSVEGLRRVPGGSINEAAVVDTSEGQRFVKWNRHPIPDQFEREAEGLEALRASLSRLVVPAPIAHRRPRGGVPAFLVLDHLEPGRRVPGFDAELGRGLAELHRTSAPSFGFAHDNYCGATPQPNPREEAWIPFYREHRLRFQIELAADGRGWSRQERADLDGLLEVLDDRLAADPEPPALIHGDLWRGNLHVAPDGRPALIDPAAYYGHREAELGMMRLFGGFSEAVWQAYREAWPLQPGWEERVELYELYHVLNHYNLFGGGYGAQAAAIARRWR